MTRCAYCRAELASGPPWAPGRGHRLAFDPGRGRLWTVCSSCTRWNLTPLEDRWETLEACERIVQDQGRIRVRTPNLALIEVKKGELIRIGAAPRSEYVDWRYGPRLPHSGAGPGFWARLLSRLPDPPLEGYDPYRGIFGAVEKTPWLASPFLGAASSLSYLFSQLPLAPRCPSCSRPLVLRPWDFQHLRIATGTREELTLAPCALCRNEVEVPLRETRSILRLGLGMVTPPSVLRTLSSRAALALDRGGGPDGFIERLARAGPALGEIDPASRAGLLIALDERAEAEALDSEWRKAEELATIMDGELTEIPGFDAFRREVLGEED